MALWHPSLVALLLMHFFTFQYLMWGTYDIMMPALSALICLHFPALLLGLFFTYHLLNILTLIMLMTILVWMIIAHFLGLQLTLIFVISVTFLFGYVMALLNGLKPTLLPWIIAADLLLDIGALRICITKKFSPPPAQYHCIKQKCT